MDTLTPARIADLPRPELCDLWRRWFKAPPPPQINRPRLVQLLAFEAQVRSSGGLDHKTRRAIARLQKQILHPGTPSRTSTPKLQPGARLIREWNGHSHVVDVTAQGVEWQGQSYTSLSAIARAMTGAHWSGPRFFGLTSTGPHQGGGNAQT